MAGKKSFGSQLGSLGVFEEWLDFDNVRFFPGEVISVKPCARHVGVITSEPGREIRKKSAGAAIRWGLPLR
jgi:hypothetical protein